MILYLCIILVSFTTICIGNCLYYSSITMALWTVLALAEVCAVDGLLAWIIHSIPEERINPFAPMYEVSTKERKFYEKLGVRKWKDSIPESGKQLCNFAKDKVEKPEDNIYLLKFLRETCYAETMHVLSFFLQFLLLLLPYIRLSVILPVLLVNGFLQLLPVIVQRYNRHRMVKLYRYNEKHSV